MRTFNIRGLRRQFQMPNNIKSKYIKIILLNNFLIKNVIKKTQQAIPQIVLINYEYALRLVDARRLKF